MQQENPHHTRRWAILAVLGIAQLMVVLDATIVNIALPSAQKALHFSSADRQWIVTAYALSFGSLLLLGGKLSDLFGRKWTFIIGLGGFGVASAVGGAAQSFIMLAAARAFQGAFGALLAPAGLSLLTTTFTEASERNRAFGIYGAIAGSGASIGLLLGGVLTQYLNWRFSMYVNAMFAVVAIAGGLSLLHNQPLEHKPKIDLPGTLAVSLGLLGLVYGFSHAETTSWTNTVTIASMAIGAGLLGLFVLLESRVAHPLLPLRVVANRNRGASFLGMALSSAAMFAVFLFLTYYLQQNRGYSPVLTGLAFLPMTAAIMVTAVWGSTKLPALVGSRVLVSGGMLLAGVGMALLTQINLTSSYVTGILPGIVIMGLGLGLVFAVAMNSGTAGVRPSDSGVASALLNACQQVGGALGTALLSTIAASATASFVGGAASHAARATVHGYTVTFTVSAAIFVAGAVLTGLLYESGAEQPATAGEPVLFA